MEKVYLFCRRKSHGKGIEKECFEWYSVFMVLNKKELRKEILKKRNTMAQEACDKNSALIVKKISSLQQYKDAHRILVYASMKSEVRTEELCQNALACGKQIYLPRVQGDEMFFYQVDEKSDLETSAWGVCEPREEDEKRFVPRENESILVIVPGVVFDKEGNRIGYGGGYYDKYLQYLKESVAGDVCAVALAYECQLVEAGSIEREAHDICVDYVVTECEVYRVG